MNWFSKVWGLILEALTYFFKWQANTSDPEIVKKNREIKLDKEILKLKNELDNVDAQILLEKNNEKKKVLAGRAFNLRANLKRLRESKAKGDNSTGV